MKTLGGWSSTVFHESQRSCGTPARLSSKPLFEGTGMLVVNLNRAGMNLVVPAVKCEHVLPDAAFYRRVGMQMSNLLNHIKAAEAVHAFREGQIGVMFLQEF